MQSCRSVWKKTPKSRKEHSCPKESNAPHHVFGMQELGSCTLPSSPCSHDLWEAHHSSTVTMGEGKKAAKQEAEALADGMRQWRVGRVWRQIVSEAVPINTESVREAEGWCYSRQKGSAVKVRVWRRWGNEGMAAMWWLCFAYYKKMTALISKHNICRDGIWLYQWKKTGQRWEERKG